MPRKKQIRKKNASIDIKIEPDIKEAFDAKCQANDVTMTSVIRAAIFKYLGEMDGESEYIKLCKALYSIGFFVEDRDDGSQHPLADPRTLFIRKEKESPWIVAEEAVFGDAKNISVIDAAITQGRCAIEKEGNL